VVERHVRASGQRHVVEERRRLVGDDEPVYGDMRATLHLEGLAEEVTIERVGQVDGPEVLQGVYREHLDRHGASRGSAGAGRRP
jgi:hypothetical protein